MPASASLTIVPFSVVQLDRSASLEAASLIRAMMWNVMPIVFVETDTAWVSAPKSAAREAHLASTANACPIFVITISAMPANTASGENASSTSVYKRTARWVKRVMPAVVKSIHVWL